MIARLFPESECPARGEARFPLNRRTAGSLNWLMMRYPLEIAARDLPRWQDAIESAREWALRRAIAEKYPEAVTPPAAFFAGELMSFQQEGLSYLLRNERALLADEMGLGKTVQAIALLAQHAAAAGADYRPAASGAQLAARNRAVSAAAGRRAGTRAARTFALRAAAGGYLHLPLSASARLEGNAAQARLQNARLR